MFDVSGTHDCTVRRAIRGLEALARAVILG